MNPFSFELRQAVTLKGSCEHGHVLGRAEHAEHGHSYLVRVVAADGGLSEMWWPASAIEAAAADTQNA